MRRMQKRIKQKSWKMYMRSGQAANVNTTPQFHQQMWVKTGEAPTILPREKHRSPLTTKAASFSYFVQIVGYISTERGIIWYFCSSWSDLHFSRSKNFVTLPGWQLCMFLVCHSRQRWRKEVSPEHIQAWISEVAAPGPRANLIHSLPFSFSILGLETIES